MVYFTLLYNYSWSGRGEERNFSSQLTPNPYNHRSEHNTGNSMPYSSQIVCGFFNVPQILYKPKGCETGPPAYSPYPRRLESLTICRCRYPECWSGWTWTHNLPRDSPVLNQLSHRCTVVDDNNGTMIIITIIILLLLLLIIIIIINVIIITEGPQHYYDDNNHDTLKSNDID